MDFGNKLMTGGADQNGNDPSEAPQLSTDIESLLGPDDAPRNSDMQKSSCIPPLTHTKLTANIHLYYSLHAHDHDVYVCVWRGGGGGVGIVNACCTYQTALEGSRLDPRESALEDCVHLANTSIVMRSLTL